MNFKKNLGENSFLPFPEFQLDRFQLPLLKDGLFGIGINWDGTLVKFRVGGSEGSGVRVGHEKMSRNLFVLINPCE